ncbi:MAG TPA: type II secretion system F family protein [Anaerolineae bacterium]|nr:type II secretion system F family protein [Anaerolineae bacterium]
MTSSKSLQKRNIKSYFEEISSFDLFYQLTYMSATAAAGISRSRVFQLARSLPCSPAKYFESIHDVAENLRYNYPDAVRLVGGQTQSEQTKTFLLRLSDALRSGEPLAPFLAREAEVQGEQYANDYLRRLESLKKWNDAYTAVTVSIALIVIINMVSTMIYNLGTTTMLLMTLVAIGGGFGVAWVLYRSAPPEVKCVPLKLGSEDQRRSRQLFFICIPLAIVACLVLIVLQLNTGWIMIAAGLFTLPIGWVSRRADQQTSNKDMEISAFLRSIGGTATSRGTTLKDALASIKLDSFPALQGDIHMLDLRLKAFGKPPLCWNTFGVETGSKLADQSVGVFHEAVNLGGDPEKAGNLTSAFALKTAMLRAQRRGVSGTFVWLTVVMHTILAALMVFLLGVLEQFAARMAEATAALNEGASASATLGLGEMFSFSAPQIQFLSTLTVAMIVILTLINAFAIVGSEGAHLIKMTLYTSMLFILSGVCFLIVPPMAMAII